VSSDPAAPYEQLARMIEHELELVNEGRYAELAEAVTRRGAALASLTIPEPESAQPAMMRARALHERLLVDTLRAREELARSIGHLKRLRRAAGGYRHSVTRRYSTTA